MSGTHTLIASLLLISLSMSSLAGTSAPCAQLSNGPGAEQVTATDAPLHHHDGATSADDSAAVSVQHSGHHGGDSSESEPGNNECPCCDGCELVCVLSSCNPAIQSILPAAPFLGGGKCCISSAVEFRSGPPKHVLYRPPISPI